MIRRIRTWINRTVTVKWALLSYAVLLSFTWIAFSASSSQNSVNREAIEAVTSQQLQTHTEKIAYDRCVAEYESKDSSRELLRFVLASSNVNNKAFQDEVAAFIAEAYPVRTLEEACGSPPFPGSDQRRGDD